MFLFLYFQMQKITILILFFLYKLKFSLSIILTSLLDVHIISIVFLGSFKYCFYTYLFYE